MQQRLAAGGSGTAASFDSSLKQRHSFVIWRCNRHIVALRPCTNSFGPDKTSVSYLRSNSLSRNVGSCLWFWTLGLRATKSSTDLRERNAILEGVSWSCHLKAWLKELLTEPSWHRHFYERTFYTAAGLLKTGQCCWRTNILRNIWKLTTLETFLHTVSCL